MSHVVLEDVTKRYAGHVALAGVSVSVEQGEMLALLGPSGCGKTTLLRCVAGLTAFDSGRLTIGGVDMTGVPVRRRPIGMVFQSYALFPNLTVRGNIGFPLTVRRETKTGVAERVEEMLELVGLSEQGDRLPNQLSGGQQQRVALARALAPRPEVLLLDEPLSALDAQVRHRLRDEVRRIQHQVGITTVFVTHDQAEALAISDRVAVMNAGDIEQCAAPSEIYTAPSTRFAAGFVGNRNTLELRTSGGRVTAGGAFDVEAPWERVLCMFRPEDVSLRREGPGARALVDVTVFLGATTRVYVQAEVNGSPATVFADLPSRAAASLSPGDAVRLSVDPGHVQVFPA
ncbi:ABC transporter ATP-binding protein [Streptosporangium carneum]|uniref:ABC-type quaternary amine transporter n=1 Tax=Streptosporangium carneum TaxID=47481 RepID=A0A9W6MFM9_9ACTN|nr:ABC transporter ATP-binding protein [Streptosporangium carneum]GLK12431.1 ABC transporter ATP-binding protein [Streptosporangium carneum]